MTAPTLPEPRPDDEGRETTGPLTMSEVNDYASAYYDYVRGKVEGLPEAFARREAYWAAYQKLSDRLAPLAPHPAPLGATAQSEPRWPDMNGPCPHGHCEWDLGSHVATPRDGLRCPGWQDGRVPYRAKTIEWSRLHDSDENAGFHKVCAPLGATDEGLREAVRAFLASWDAMAPFTTRDAPMIAALRAALQAGG